MTELDDAIARGWAEARGEDPQPTVAYFRDLLGRHPRAPEALFGYASALDFAGQEADAAPVYEQAFAAGLDGDDLRQGLTQYGSTLRNLGRYDEAIAALEKAGRLFPGHDSVQLFLALTLAGAGRCHDAVAGLITLALDRLDGDDVRQYERPLRAYAAELTG